MESVRLMAPITSSFIHDIEAAILAEINTKLGPNSALYPSPAWLQVQWAGRTGGRPTPRTTEDQNPHVYMEYLAGGGTGFLVGSQSRLPSMGRELWNVYAVLIATPQFMEMEDMKDVEAFKAYALAAADTLARRLMLLLADFEPNVHDSLLGYLTNGQRVNAWGLVAVAEGDLRITYRSLIRYESIVERN